MSKKIIFFTFFLKSHCFKIFFLTFLIIYAGSIKADERLYMMPYEQADALKALISSISNAKKNINISIYSFTNKEIAKALRDASGKGVKINIIYDMGQKKIANSTIGYLEKFANIHTCLLEGNQAKGGKYKGIMHQKMIIVDNALIGLGSANWSKNAFENSYETLFFTDSQEIIQKASMYYSKMLSICIPFINY
ncbi:nuclease NucT [Helicobacter didelphidarum]|uniref:phospholipase D n=1 Tax=Helicobacter didelphidarum TaxID=2040648 RepID=A0A3D8IR49_9HELI|nr:phospholipase D-like domain-containing protein [Helicobacter didelphidarum]RDU67583.1 nuclease NucT [Helicobacter didelphidarum]